MSVSPDLARLAELVGIEWNDPRLLEEAACDESFANENRASAPVNNYRLAFLGDAVLELVARGQLVRDIPQASHGELSETADGIVPNEALANAARALALGPLLGLGNGRRDEDSTTVLARAFEAILGAVYVDQGFECAAGVANRWLPNFRQHLSQPCGGAAV